MKLNAVAIRVYHIFIANKSNVLYIIFRFALGELARLLKAYDEVKKELIETKSQVVVAEYKRETEFQHQGRRAQEEIASLQQLVHGKQK